MPTNTKKNVPESKIKSTYKLKNKYIGYSNLQWSQKTTERQISKFLAWDRHKNNNVLM